MARTPADIRALTDEELEQAMADNHRESLNLRLQLQTGQLENTARIRVLRREYARLMTENTASAQRRDAQQAN